MTSPEYTLLSETIDESAIVASGPEDAPIVLLLHGLGSHERDLTSMVPHLPRAFRYVSLRAIYAYGPGYAWFELGTTDVDAATTALEQWIDGKNVIGAIGFSQGGLMALQLLRRGHLRFVANLSGWPLPVPQPKDAALAENPLPVFWGHGGQDPFYDEASTAAIREFLTAHTDLTEVDRPMMGHAVDQVEFAELLAFMQAQSDCLLG